MFSRSSMAFIQGCQTWLLHIYYWRLKAITASGYFSNWNACEFNPYTWGHTLCQWNKANQPSAASHVGALLNIYVTDNEWMVLQATILHSKAILGRGQPEQMRWILLWIMPMVQVLLLDLLTSSPASYHCATDTAVQT